MSDMEQEGLTVSASNLNINSKDTNITSLNTNSDDYMDGLKEVTKEELNTKITELPAEYLNTIENVLKEIKIISSSKTNTKQEKSSTLEDTFKNKPGKSKPTEEDVKKLPSVHSIGYLYLGEYLKKFIDSKKPKNTLTKDSSKPNFLSSIKVTLEKINPFKNIGNSIKNFFSKFNPFKNLKSFFSNLKNSLFPKSSLKDNLSKKASIAGVLIYTGNIKQDIMAMKQMMKAISYIEKIKKPNKENYIKAKDTVNLVLKDLTKLNKETNVKPILEFCEKFKQIGKSFSQGLGNIIFMSGIAKQASLAYNSVGYVKGKKETGIFKYTHRFFDSIVELNNNIDVNASQKISSKIGDTVKSFRNILLDITTVGVLAVPIGIFSDNAIKAISKIESFLIKLGDFTKNSSKLNFINEKVTDKVKSTIAFFKVLGKSAFEAFIAGMSCIKAVVSLNSIQKYVSALSDFVASVKNLQNVDKAYLNIKQYTKVFLILQLLNIESIVTGFLSIPAIYSTLIVNKFLISLQKMSTTLNSIKAPKTNNLKIFTSIFLTISAIALVSIPTAVLSLTACFMMPFIEVFLNYFLSSVIDSANSLPDTKKAKQNLNLTPFFLNILAIAALAIPTGILAMPASIALFGINIFIGLLSTTIKKAEQIPNMKNTLHLMLLVPFFTSLLFTSILVIATSVVSSVAIDFLPGINDFLLSLGNTIKIADQIPNMKNTLHLYLLMPFFVSIFVTASLVIPTSIISSVAVEFLPNVNSFLNQLRPVIESANKIPKLKNTFNLYLFSVFLVSVMFTATLTYITGIIVSPTEHFLQPIERFLTQLSPVVQAANKVPVVKGAFKLLALIPVLMITSFVSVLSIVAGSTSFLALSFLTPIEKFLLKIGSVVKAANKVPNMKKVLQLSLLVPFFSLVLIAAILAVPTGAFALIGFIALFGVQLFIQEIVTIANIAEKNRKKFFSLTLSALAILGAVTVLAATIFLMNTFISIPNVLQAVASMFLLGLFFGIAIIIGAISKECIKYLLFTLLASAILAVVSLALAVSVQLLNAVQPLLLKAIVTLGVCIVMLAVCALAGYGAMYVLGFLGAFTLACVLLAVSALALNLAVTNLSKVEIKSVLMSAAVLGVSTLMMLAAATAGAAAIPATLGLVPLLTASILLMATAIPLKVAITKLSEIDWSSTLIISAGFTGVLLMMTAISLAGVAAIPATLGLVPLLTASVLLLGLSIPLNAALIKLNEIDWKSTLSLTAGFGGLALVMAAISAAGLTSIIALGGIALLTITAIALLGLTLPLNIALTKLNEINWSNLSIITNGFSNLSSLLWAASKAGLASIAASIGLGSLSEVSSELEPIAISLNKSLKALEVIEWNNIELIDSNMSKLPSLFKNIYKTVDNFNDIKVKGSFEEKINILSGISKSITVLQNVNWNNIDGLITNIGKLPSLFKAINKASKDLNSINIKVSVAEDITSGSVKIGTALKSLNDVLSNDLNIAEEGIKLNDNFIKPLQELNDPVRNINNLTKGIRDLNSELKKFAKDSKDSIKILKDLSTFKDSASSSISTGNTYIRDIKAEQNIQSQPIYADFSKKELQDILEKVKDIYNFMKNQESSSWSG